MIFGAILAGGTGTRMNIADTPKQFLPLGSEKPVIIHTLEKFLLCARFDAIYVGVHPDWLEFLRDLLGKYGIPQQRVFAVVGGTDRNATIRNIITAIEENNGASDDHIIITHDAVRPFVTLRILEDSIDATLAYGACDTVVPATDTIVVSAGGATIDDIPQRNLMYQGQTPQGFKVSLLRELMDGLSDEERATLTDACKICFLRDVPVYLVTGEVSNLKLTTIADYKVAQAMIESGCA